MKTKRSTALLCAFVAALAAPAAMGAFTFTNGDLILGFQATGGVGATQNVFFNLGSGTYHRDNPGYNFGVATNGNNPFGTTGQTVIGNVNATLTVVYGANWFDRSDLYFGVIGNLNQQPNSGVGSRAPVNGDPSRTVYVSSQTDTIGGALLYTAGAYNPSSLGIGANNLTGLEGIFSSSNLTNGSDNTKILTQASAPTQWNNGWTAWNPTPGAAFGVFTGGIQQNFGESDNITMVDLQRVLATNTGASPTGVAGGGTYETTFAITRNGNVFAIPEPSTALLGGLGVLALFRRRRA